MLQQLARLSSQLQAILPRKLSRKALTQARQKEGTDQCKENREQKRSEIIKAYEDIDLEPPDLGGQRVLRERGGGGDGVPPIVGVERGRRLRGLTFSLRRSSSASNKDAASCGSRPLASLFHRLFLGSDIATGSSSSQSSCSTTNYESFLPSREVAELMRPRTMRRRLHSSCLRISLYKKNKSEY
ncbi:hypothetical protein NL676_007989 [Syzygium grande]|nr:hypothetical protein NL676_007989 [Syzygium grande]